MIQNPTKLTLARGQIALHNDEGIHSLPLEDIAALILESPEITVTSALLSACMEQGVAVVTCNATHTPNGVLHPFLPHSRQSKVAKLQLSWSEPLRKRLWQQIVQAKITNQAACLALFQGEEAALRLRVLAKQVQSGDPDNKEAQAAREYWPKLFGKPFTRGNEDSINAALNYGYAVVRAFVARSQVAYGLLPAFGIHHESELNAFNLTDDLMETLRPVVDRQVFQMREAGDLNTDEAKLSKENRQKLATIGATLCLLEGERHNLMNAADKMAAGLVAAIEHKSAALLPLPQLLPAEKPL
jgi:CRISPR-associated protein Cas1